MNALPKLTSSDPPDDDLAAKELRAKQLMRERQRRRRHRADYGGGIAPLPYDPDLADFLVEAGVLPEALIEDRDAIGMAAAAFIMKCRHA